MTTLLLCLLLQDAPALTEKLRAAVPGAAERIRNGGDAACAKLLIEAAKIEGLMRADLDPLAAPALRGAKTAEEMRAVYDAIETHVLVSALPELLRIGELPREQRLSDHQLPSWVLVEQLGREGVGPYGPVLLRMLEMPDEPRLQALVLLASDNVQAALPVIFKIAAKEKDNPHLREKAFEALGRAKHPGTKVLLLMALQEAHDTPRTAALRGLALLGDPDVADQVAKQLACEYWTVRAEACRTLADLGAVQHAAAVAAILNDETELAWSSAADAVGRLGGKPQRLIALLDRQDCFYSAAEALGRLRAKEALPALMKHARVGQPHAARAVGEISLEAARELAADPDPRAKESGIIALAWAQEPTAVAPPAPDVKAVLQRARDALNRKDERDLAAAIRELPGTGSRDFDKDLETLAIRPFSMVGAADPPLEAAIALCRLGSVKSVPRILLRGEQIVDPNGGLGPPLLPNHPDHYEIGCLNALRKPAVYERLSKKLVAWRPFLRADEFWSQVERESGLKIDAARYSGWSRPWTEPTLTFSLPGGTRSVREAIEYALMLSPYEHVLEDDRIRILGRTEALNLWKSWAATR